MSIAEDIARVAGGIAFGILGGGPSLEVADAIERSGGRFHTTRFEGAAALMAGAVGRLTGQPGVAIAIKGPGLANMAAGLATCRLEDFPVLAVAEAYGRGTGTEKAHKRLDQEALASAVTKARQGLADPDAAVLLTALAVAERPGPVLLELADTGASLGLVSPTGERNIDLLLRVIENAARPLVIAGSLAGRQGWTASLNALAIPVFSTASAKGVVDEKLPHAAGVYTGAGRALAPEHSVLKQADLAVGFGLRTHELLLAGLPMPAVNVDDIDLAPGFALVGAASMADGPLVLAALGAKRPWGANAIAEAKARMRAALLAGPFLPAQAFTILARHLAGARLVLDTGLFCTMGEHLWEASQPDLYLSSGQGRSMGAALPMAVAAAMARPEVPTVLAIGDGGIGMFFMELSLASAERAPLLILFMHDGTQASVRHRAVVGGLTERPLIYLTPDWVAVASALGLIAQRVDNASDLCAFVTRWVPQQGPALVEIRFDPEPYRVMTRELRA
jgi:acetolactate synthase I/II/III large subunit